MMTEEEYRATVREAEAEYETRIRPHVPERRDRARAYRRMLEAIVPARKAFYVWWRLHVSKGVEPWEK